MANNNETQTVKIYTALRTKTCSVRKGITQVRKNLKDIQLSGECGVPLEVIEAAKVIDCWSSATFEDLVGA